MPFRLPRGLALLSSCLLLAPAPLRAAAPLEWRWSDPSPSGVAVNALAWRTNRLLLAAGERGQLRVGVDPDSLRTVPLATAKSLRSAAYLGDRAVVVGEGGVVAWSDDDRFQVVETGRTNWLEGVAASADRLVAVGDAGLVLVSTNGTAWTAGSVGATNWLRGVAYGSGLFLAVGESGFVASSPDGVAWTRLAAGRTAAHLNAAAPVPTGFLVVGDQGVVLASRSPQLTQWDLAAVATTQPLNAVVATGANERLVAGGGGVWFGVQVGSAFVWSSEVTGLRASTAPAEEYLSLVSDGSRVVAGTRYEGVAVGVRSTAFAGYAWTHTPPVGAETIWDVAPVSAEGTNVAATLQGGAVVLVTNTAPSVSLVAVGERARILDSPDGRTWNRGLAPASATNVDYLGIAARSRLALVVGSGGAVARSVPEFLPVVTTNVFTNAAGSVSVVLTNQVNLLGIAWDAVASGVTNDLQSVALTDSLAVAVGSAGTILTSPDGLAWTRRASGTTAYLSSVAAWPGGFVATGADGVVVTSPDGIRWTASTPSGTGWLWRVRWIRDRLMAVGQGGRLLVSSDGASWTRVPTGTDVWWNDVAESGATWYLAGDAGAVGVSTNRTDWVVQGAPTSRSLYAAAVHGDRLVVAGTAGGILRSRVAPWPEPVRLLSFPKTPDENLFLFGGQPDQPFVFERSSDLATWFDASPMEITDPNGVLLLLDTATNAPATQFFRTRTP